MILMESGCELFQKLFVFLSVVIVGVVQLVLALLDVVVDGLEVLSGIEDSLMCRWALLLKENKAQIFPNGKLYCLWNAKTIETVHEVKNQICLKIGQIAAFISCWTPCYQHRLFLMLFTARLPWKQYCLYITHVWCDGCAYLALIKYWCLTLFFGWVVRLLASFANLILTCAYTVSKASQIRDFWGQPEVDFLIRSPSTWRHSSWIPFPSDPRIVDTRSQRTNKTCSWCYKTFFGGNLYFPKIKKLNKVCSNIQTFTIMWKLSYFWTKLYSRTVDCS